MPRTARPDARSSLVVTTARSFALFLFCLFAAGAAAQEQVSFLTVDNVRIHADWYASSPESNRVLILLHMNGHDRSDWQNFAEAAIDKGLHCLAIDLRGHGQSTIWGLDTLRVAELTPADYAAMPHDLDAAVRWIRQSLGKIPAIGIIGASVGANLALIYANDHPDIRAVSLISPGLDYRDLLLEPALRSYQPRPVLLIAASDDNYSAVTVQQVTREGAANTTQYLYEHGGHGTYLFEAHSDLPARLLDYMNQQLN